jgi:hypothetical protein
MNKREYLRSQGFKVGERGRFTPEMLTALKDFKEPTEAPPRVLDVEVYNAPIKFKLPDEPRMREPRTLYGYTREGYKVGFILCQSCTKHMMFCSCHKGVTAPTIVVRSDEKEVYVRTKVG